MQSPIGDDSQNRTARRRSPVAVVVAAIALVVGAALWISYWSVAQEPIRLGENAALASPELGAALGEPLTFGRFPAVKIWAKDGSGNAGLSIPVYGNLGHGRLLEWAQENAGKWQLCSLAFRSSDESRVITILNADDTHCERGARNS